MSRSTSALLPEAALVRPPARYAGPRGWRVVRDVLQMRRDRIGLVTRAAREYGDVVHFRLGPRHLVLVSDPDGIRRVLVDNEGNYRKGLGLADARPMLGDGLLTSEGERWAARRRTMQPIFHAAHLERFGDAVIEAARETAASWSAAGPQPIDLGRDMRRLTLSAFAGGVLGVDVGARRDALIDAFGAVEAWAMARSVALMPAPAWMPGAANRRVRRALRELDVFVEAVLDAVRSRRGGGPFDGVITALDREGGAAARDELMTLLLAGHETTGAALAWIWSCLGRHPEVETRVHRELDEVLGDRRVSLADLPRLPYTRAVVDETLRLYPPVWLVPRQALGADTICGDAVGHGADVLLCAYTLHRNARYWPEPDRFDPDRFARAADVRPAGVYLPFGAGPRACAGSRFAIVEAMLVVAELGRTFRLRGPFEQVVPEPSLTLRFPEGVAVHAGRRGRGDPA